LSGSGSILTESYIFILDFSVWIKKRIPTIRKKNNPTVVSQSPAMFFPPVILYLYDRGGGDIT
jgi:hypothetical protein